MAERQQLAYGTKVSRQACSNNVHSGCHLHCIFVPLQMLLLVSGSAYPSKCRPCLAAVQAVLVLLSVKTALAEMACLLDLLSLVTGCIFHSSGRERCWRRSVLFSNLFRGGRQAIACVCSTIRRPLHALAFC